jgi:hypothetical protein
MSRLSESVSPLAGISLSELDRRAALQRRTDTKYVVTWDQLRALTGDLAADHQVLEIDGRRSFTYESVYFDTPDLDSFRAHVEDRVPRFKVRSRLYVDSGTSSFELKVKLAAGETAKRSVDQDARSHGELTEADRRFLAEHLDALVGDGAPPPLQRTLLTRFERATLVARSGGDRLTIDAALELRAPDGRAVRLRDEHAIVETKSKSGDERPDRLLRDRGVEPVSLSKYRVGVGLLLATDPEPQLGGSPERLFAPVHLD